MGAMAGYLHTLEEKSFTWYKTLRSAIDKIDRKEDVLLGFTYTRAYSHASIAARDTMQHVLKGEDIIIYHILKRLATDTRVDIILDARPVNRGRDREGARTVIADSQEDESQLFDEGYKQPGAEDLYTIPHSQLECPIKTRPIDPDPLKSVKWLNHSPHSARAQKNPVVAYTEPNDLREAGVYQASFVIVATLTTQRKGPPPGQKRKRDRGDEGNRMILNDGYATITKVQGDAYNVTIVRKGEAKE